LASAGKKVFAVSPACFLTARALEQIKNDVAYSDNPVKVIGISAGVSYGSLGSTHHSLHDFAALQAINNIDIIAPATISRPAKPSALPFIIPARFTSVLAKSRCPTCTLPVRALRLVKPFN
jgi:transketolase